MTKTYLFYFGLIIAGILVLLSVLTHEWRRLRKRTKLFNELRKLDRMAAQRQKMYDAHQAAERRCEES